MAQHTVRNETRDNPLLPPNLNSLPLFHKVGILVATPHCCVCYQPPYFLFPLSLFFLPRAKTNYKSTTTNVAHINGAGHGLRRPRCRERNRLAHAPQSRDAEERSGGRPPSSYSRLGRVPETYSSATASDRAKQTEHVVPAVYRHARGESGRGAKKFCVEASRNIKVFLRTACQSYGLWGRLSREVARGGSFARSEMARFVRQQKHAI